MPQQEFFDSLRRYFSESIRHSRVCGMQIDAVESGRAQASLPYRDQWLGDPERGLVHTGVVSSLIDSVCGLAALSAMTPAERVATLDLRIDYLRPALPKQTLHARAECYRLTRTIAFVRAMAWQNSETEPCAASQASFMRIALRRSKGELSLI